MYLLPHFTWENADCKIIVCVHKFLGISLRADINSCRILAPKLAERSPRNGHSIVFFIISCRNECPIIFERYGKVFIQLAEFNFFKHNFTSVNYIVKYLYIFFYRNNIALKLTQIAVITSDGLRNFILLNIKFNNILISYGVLIIRVCMAV